MLKLYSHKGLSEVVILGVAFKEGGK